MRCDRFVDPPTIRNQCMYRQASRAARDPNGGVVHAIARSFHFRPRQPRLSGNPGVTNYVPEPTR